MTQKTHLDDFLCGRTTSCLEYECIQVKVSEELGIAKSVISRLWQRFKNDGNVSRRYSTDHPKLQCQMRTSIWQLLPKDQTEHIIRPVLSALFRHALVRQFQGRLCSDA
ncbi:uncharacterized protein TNCV_633101 [Trichonephila clavipes]|nr:uncharacterized protein TNCV_633101 [Trichonephila clavipes]